MPSRPLTTAELEEKLDEVLDPVLSSRRTAAGLAKALTAFARERQDFIIHWVDVIAKTNAELAYQFAARAPEALRLMDLSGIEKWIVHAMDVYDKNGLYPGCSAIHNVLAFTTELRAAARGVAYADVSGVLELFLCGLSGRQLKINVLEPPADAAPAQARDARGAYTDTGSLFLPAHLALFDTRDDNYRLYKAVVAHLWAQTWFGTFREQLSLDKALRRFSDPYKALRLFHALETVRLDACLAVELPGLHRDMTALQAKRGPIRYSAQWQLPIRRLQQPQATVLDTHELLEQLYPGEVPAALCYQGVLYPDRTEQAMADRIAREKNGFRAKLTKLAEDMHGKLDTAVDDEAKTAPRSRRFSMKRTPDRERPGLFNFELALDGKPIVPPANLKALLDSIVQDLGEIPEDYLTAAGDGGYRAEEVPEKNPENVWKGTYHEEGALLYNEWDFRRKHYRKNWCVLREIDVHPNEEPFVEQTLNKYAGILGPLRKTFEALRGEDKLLRKQTSGDDIDFDALVDGYAEMKRGMELPQRLFTKLHKLDRNIAVLFMVDMSGSTKGWINDAERESLVLLCEALEVLGDRYAIYGFSGMTRKRCELYRIKHFDEPYSDAVRRRIAGVKPQDYTRMGVIIRHLTKLLDDVDARTKLLITLSDGKPDDYDGYRGDYGIEDTRMALIEAKHAGIHPFCITIDTEARDYLPHMYGAVNWTLVDNVRKLPVRVSEIYRKLTL